MRDDTVLLPFISIARHPGRYEDKKGQICTTTVSGHDRLTENNFEATWCICLTNTLFLQKWDFYEFSFLRDGPYFFKVNAL